MWTEALKGTAREESDKRDMRRMLKPLRDVWLTIEIEKVNIHERVIVKALLDSGATGMFMNKRTVAKHGFRLQKLERPLGIKNVNGIDNSGRMIMHQIEVSVYYQNHIKRIRCSNLA